jgi:cellulose/xylan binding protein with CBM9 domain
MKPAILALSLMLAALIDAGAAHLVATRTEQPIKIDGEIEEAAWQTAAPITLFQRTRDKSRCEVRLLWNDEALYAAFDVSDECVETSAHDWDDDGAGISFTTQGTLRKFRRDIGGTGEGLGHTAAAFLKPGTTLNGSDDKDTGYQMEMAIPWSVLGGKPQPGASLSIDVMVTDHDRGANLPWNGPGVNFSKVSIDKDQNIDTTKSSVRLVRETTEEMASQTFEIDRGRLAEWLVAGPFAGSSIDEDFLGGEAAARPRPGGDAEKIRWKLLSANEAVNFEEPEACDLFDDAMVYAGTYVFSETERRVLLLAGSDDGLKVWVNGRCVWRNDMARGLKPDEDRIHIVLKKGWNFLLFKVKDFGGGCGLTARLAESPKTPAEKLQGSLAPKQTE